MSLDPFASPFSPPPSSSSTALQEEVIPATILDKKPVETNETKKIYYQDIMRRLSAIQRLEKNAGADLGSLYLKDEDKGKSIGVLRSELTIDLKNFIKIEKERLKALDSVSGGISGKSNEYLGFLTSLLKELDSSEKNILDKTMDFVKCLFGFSKPNEIQSARYEQIEFKMPDKPGVFNFTDSPLKLKSVSGLKAKKETGQNLSSLLKGLKNFVSIEEVSATDPVYLPTLADVKSDRETILASDSNSEDIGEVVISKNITDLAATLENNPVKIFNYLKNNIKYEPYYGAKKGSTGCLKEKVCNDTDSAF